MTFVKYAAECEKLPAWYGVAWRHYDMCRVVLLPVPLNLIAGLVRRWYHALRVGVQPSIIDQERLSAWQDARGLTHGELKAAIRRVTEYEDLAAHERVQPILGDVQRKQDTN